MWEKTYSYKIAGKTTMILTQATNSKLQKAVVQPYVLYGPHMLRLGLTFGVQPIDWTKFNHLSWKNSCSRHVCLIWSVRHVIPTKAHSVGCIYYTNFIYVWHLLISEINVRFEASIKYADLQPAVLLYSCTTYAKMLHNLLCTNNSKHSWI